MKRYHLRDMKESIFSLDNCSMKEELGFVEAYSKDQSRQVRGKFQFERTS